MMYEEGSEFLYPFKHNGTRSWLGLRKIYSDQEKLSALKKMVENTSFLSHLLERTKWENIRLRTQKELLNEIYKVLYEFELEEYVNEYNNRENLVGMYKDSERGQFQIFIKDGELIGKALSFPNQPEFKLVYSKENEYIFTNFELTLTFTTKGKDKGNLKVRLNGNEFNLKKVEDSKN